MVDGMKYITQHPIKKSDLGFHGNLFGGKLLAWLDAKAAKDCFVSFVILLGWLPSQ